MRISMSAGLMSASVILATAGSAEAGRPVTYLSGKGADTGSCPVTAPCRTLQYALGQTVANGEVHAVDAASYSAATVTRNVNIIGVPGASLTGSVAYGLGNAVLAIKNTAPKVELSNFIIDAGVTGSNVGGIYAATPGLTVKNCIVRDAGPFGILAGAESVGNTLIEDTIVENTTGTGNAGILISSYQGVYVTLNRVTVTKGAAPGVKIDSGSNVTITNSVVSSNNSDGINNSGQLTLQSSTISWNTGFGVNSHDGGSVKSAGNNAITANVGGATAGSFTNFGTK